jgi:hypothetical protein
MLSWRSNWTMHRSRSGELAERRAMVNAPTFGPLNAILRMKDFESVGLFRSVNQVVQLFRLKNCVSRRDVFRRERCGHNARQGNEGERSNEA